MRAAFLCLVLLLALFAVRWFRPSPAAAAPQGQPTEAGEARFLTPPPATPAVQSRAPAQEAVHAPEPVQETAGDVVAPAYVEVPAGLDDELSVAMALVHGTPPDVQKAAAGMQRSRALLIESFAWELAGEHQLAISLSSKISKGEVDGRESALLETALSGKSAAPASTSTSALTLAMEMALLERESAQALSAREYPSAARGYSTLLVRELDAPWPAEARSLAEWTQALDQAQTNHRWNPRGDWSAVELVVQAGDSLITIRKRYLAQRPDALMCTGLIERANRVRGFLQPGQTLRVPVDPVRVMVDVEARWALYFLGDEVAASWPVGVGRPGEETPPGDYQAGDKLENPPWMKTGQEMIPFGDPRNPLGTRWIGWYQNGRKTSLGFHGTWVAESIGQGASDGCVRFLNADVEQLFQILPEGAPIHIQG